MSKEPTKAELLAQIGAMKAERRDTAEEALIRAIAGVVADTNSATSIKHMFYRKDGDAVVQISLDMHEVLS